MSFVYVGNHDPKNFPAQEMEDMLALTSDRQFVWIPMPAISSSLTEAQVREIARDIVGTMLQHGPEAAMIIGEYSVTMLGVAMMQEHGVPCYFGVSDRVATEKKQPDGSTKMEHVFSYITLRKAPEIRLA